MVATDDDTVPNKASVWDAASGKFVPAAENINWNTSDQLVACLSPDGSLLAITARVTDANMVQIWDVKAKRPIANLEGHRGAIQSLEFRPDGALLAAASQDGTVVLWKIGSR